MGFGFDLGMQYELSENWRFASVLRDATSTFNAWIFNIDNDMQQVFILLEMKYLKMDWS